MELSQNWLIKIEKNCIPLGAVSISMLIFGIFCAAVGTNSLAVYASIYKAAFGSWYSCQNTLIRAAPLMLSYRGLKLNNVQRIRLILFLLN